MPRLAAVIPSYQPDVDVVERVRHTASLRGVDEVVVVDDGSVGADFVLDQLQAFATVQRLGENRGIAAALNAGVEWALARGADFVLTLDQDTTLPADYVAVALDIFANAHPVARVGIVCVDGVNGHPAIPQFETPDGYHVVPEAIQTGMVVSRECLEVAGLFDARLVIDCVDTEYCMRVRHRGFQIVIARGTDVAHTIGVRAELRPFGIPVHDADGAVSRYQYHRPFRRYYITRNNIDLGYRELRSQPRWVLSVLKRETLGTALSIVSGPKRFAEFVSIAVGTAHGLVRRRGKIPPWLRRLDR